jgi:hypothetical protein
MKNVFTDASNKLGLERPKLAPTDEMTLEQIEKLPLEQSLKKINELLLSKGLSKIMISSLIEIKEDLLEKDSKNKPMEQWKKDKNEEDENERKNKRKSPYDIDTPKPR